MADPIAAPPPTTRLKPHPPPLCSSDLPTQQSPEPSFSMDSSLILSVPPPLDPAWLAHEASLPLLPGPAVPTTASERQQQYSARCKKLNQELLSGRDKHLTEGLTIYDTEIESSPPIPIRRYSASEPPTSSSSSSPCSSSSPKRHIRKGDAPTIIYLHGGGLTVGDLSSEDLTCRRLATALTCTVYSIGYRLLPSSTASDALADAITAVHSIAKSRPSSSSSSSRLLLMGSSSGGQLAAQVAQHFKHHSKKATPPTATDSRIRIQIHGVALRAPVTCNATARGIHLPRRFRAWHTSMSTAFHSSLLSAPALDADNRTREPLPLEGDVGGLARHWIQVCTNDIYYSDGVCYAEALRAAGVRVRLDVVSGWPHTFWLKAPCLERAVGAEREMVEGVRWLLEEEEEEEDVEV